MKTGATVCFEEEGGGEEGEEEEEEATRLTEQEWLDRVEAAMASFADENDVLERDTRGLVLLFARRLFARLKGAELAVGMSLLSGSRKSEKLAFAFERLASPTTKKADVLALARLLRSVLVAVYCSTTLDLPQNDEEETLAALSAEARALAAAIAADKEEATFDEFGTWYNSVGFESAPWLELLDLSKWPKTGGKRADKKKQPSTSFVLEEDKEASFLVTFDAETFPDDEPLGQPPDAAPGALKVQFTATAVARLRSFSVSSGLFECDAADLCRALLSSSASSKSSSKSSSRPETNRRGERRSSSVVTILGNAKRPALDATDVPAILTDLLSAEDFRSANDRHAGLLRALLYAFRVRADPRLPRCVEAQDLAAAMTLFCAGSKSTKLAVAWDVLCADPDASTLDRRGLWRFVRAFLVVLLVLASCPVL